MLREHIRAISAVVRVLSRELDTTEDRCLTAIAALKQQVGNGVCVWSKCHALQVSQAYKGHDTQLATLAAFQQQQDGLNSKTAASIQQLAADHRSLQVSFGP